MNKASEAKYDDLKNKVASVVAQFFPFEISIKLLSTKMNQKDNVLQRAAMELERVKPILQAKTKEVTFESADDLTIDCKV
jgi:hypothetical protein